MVLGLQAFFLAHQLAWDHSMKVKFKSGVVRLRVGACYLIQQ